MDENLSVVILQGTKITTGYTQSNDEAVDLGAYSTIGVQFTVVNAGTGTGGATLQLLHCATRFGEYLALSGAAVVIDSTGVSSFVGVTAFSRFVKLKCIGTVGGSPVVAVDAIAKR